MGHAHADVVENSRELQELPDHRNITACYKDVLVANNRLTDAVRLIICPVMLPYELACHDSALELEAHLRSTQIAISSPDVV